MLKSFGIDPEAIKQQFQQTAADVMQKVDAIQATQARIENKLDFVLGCLEKTIPIAPGNMDSMNAIESEAEELQFSELTEHSKAESIHA